MIIAMIIKSNISQIISKSIIIWRQPTAKRINIQILIIRLNFFTQEISQNTIFKIICWKIS
ncbi:hypothetical protein BK640_28680 [Pseudomonas protegens]|nr:hypothetical protein BK640_28680 [Pseudomonas protegens]